MSACRTSITEVYQTGGTPPGAGNWGCENVTSTYVQALDTDANGVITATVQGISTAVDTTTVRLVPTVGGADADVTAHMGLGVNGWKCGPGANNGIDPRYLPGSCRSS
jgi:type IV pilus assembly protein PilA